MSYGINGRYSFLFSSLYVHTYIWLDNNISHLVPCAYIHLCDKTVSWFVVSPVTPLCMPNGVSTAWSQNTISQRTLGFWRSFACMSEAKKWPQFDIIGNGPYFSYFYLCPLPSFLLYPTFYWHYIQCNRPCNTFNFVDMNIFHFHQSCSWTYNACCCLTLLWIC